MKLRDAYDKFVVEVGNKPSIAAPALLLATLASIAWALYATFLKATCA